MAKPMRIQLPGCDAIPILYEDRSVIAIDKPAGWMLVPVSWQRTQRNLQAAILSSIEAGDFWARSRSLRFLQYIHRLDAETSGVMLFAKSRGALDAIGDLFEARQVEKVYHAVTAFEPRQKQWDCEIPLAPDPRRHGRMHDDPEGKDAYTAFKWVASAGGRHLIECRPRTGRQHQIRLHLTLGGCPIVGDYLYGPDEGGALALRASGIAYWDPFSRKPVGVRSPSLAFLRPHGFEAEAARFQFTSLDKPPTKRAQRLFDRREVEVEEELPDTVSRDPQRSDERTAMRRNDGGAIKGERSPRFRPPPRRGP